MEVKKNTSVKILFSTELSYGQANWPMGLMIICIFISDKNGIGKGIKKTIFFPTPKIVEVNYNFFPKESQVFPDLVIWAWENFD